MRTSGINHVSIHANDLDESVRFYVELLEADLLDTPNFGVPVQWLGLGDTQLHVFVRDAEPPEPPPLRDHGRRSRAGLPARRGARRVRPRSHGNHIIELPGDVAQTYVRDPAGNLMEIDTPGASRLPEALRAQMRGSTTCIPQNEREPARRGCT